MIMAGRRLLRFVALAALTAALLAVQASRPVSAFDGGYHIELTRDALAGLGASRDAVAVVQLGNFHTDGFSAAKTVMADRFVRLARLDRVWDRLYGPAEFRELSEAWMHFGGLADTAEVVRAWERLIVSTHRAVREAESRGDTAGLLTVLGMSLHQVQDFYSHSNWVDLDFGAEHGREATWFDIPPAVRDGLDIYTTGRRPDPAPDKDYPPSPGFERAYREAYHASVQWVELVRTWVHPDFWQGSLGYRDPSAGRELVYVNYFCWYSGHWKGPSSENLPRLALVGALFIAGRDRQYVEKWKEYGHLMGGTGEPEPAEGGGPGSPVAAGVGHMGRAATGPPPPDDRAPGDPVDWLEVRITRVSPAGGGLHQFLGSLGRAGLYAVVEIDGVAYVEAMHGGGGSFSPRNWVTLSPLLPGRTEVDIRISVRSERIPGIGALSGSRLRGDAYDVTHEPGETSWAFVGARSGFAGGRTFVTAGHPPGGVRSGAGSGGRAAELEFTITFIHDPRVAPVPGR